MSGAKAVAALVTGLGFMLAVGVVVTYFLFPEADYAHLDPEPDVVVWEEGDETTLWLDTNRRHVDMRIDRVSLGLGDIRRIFPESGRVVTLGRGEGCLDWAVSGLEVYSLVDSGNDKRVGIQGTVDRGGTTGSLDVEWRIYKIGESPPGSLLLPATVSSGSNSFSHEIVVSNDGDRVIEASHDNRFPEPYTRRITLDLNDINTATTDSDVEHVRMVQHGGVGVIACAEDNDVGIGLHGDERALLNHYLVDVHADPTPVPTAVPQTAPSGAQYQDIRVCVDSADARANYLDGWEYVGPALDSADFGATGDILAVVIEDTVETNEFVYFFATEIDGGDVQLRATPAGASNTVGLSSDRVYPITVTATTAGARQDSIDLGVWLDITTLSPGDDGRCN